MRVLLDTHVVLWATTDPHRLGRHRDLVADPGVTRLLSAAVVCEVAIKFGLGRLDLGPGVVVADWLAQVRADLVMEDVPIVVEHAAAVADLPHHHRDPFDRLLVAQARSLSVPLLSADPAMRAYDVEILAIDPTR